MVSTLLEFFNKKGVINSKFSNDTLYVIVPYFNFVNYKSGIRNLEIFIKNLSIHENVKTVLVEGYYKEERLPDYSDQIFMHIKLPLKHVLWVKENLINIGFSKLPSDWQYGAWIDRDILFCNPNWVNETIEKLKTCDIIQPWKECLLLNESYQQDNYFHPTWTMDKSTLTIDSFCYIKNLKENGIYVDPKLWPHCGQAWAINRNFYKKIGKLYEYCLLGGADGLMKSCLENPPDAPWLIKKLGNTAIDYFHLLRSGSTNYVNGLILHYWHGDIKNRNYSNRNSVLWKTGYDPIQHIQKNEQGIIEYTEAGLFLETIVKDYLVSRQE